MNLSGQSTATTTADTNGNYSFTSLVAGSYTVTPTKAGFALTPTSTNITLSSANAMANLRLPQRRHSRSLGRSRPPPAAAVRP